MVQSKIRICLFKLFLLSQIFIASLWASQVVASVLIPTDVERDLEEVQLIHDAELRYMAEFESQWSLKIGDTDCQLFGCGQLLDSRGDLISDFAGSLRNLKLDSNLEVPPTPRRFDNESDLPSAASSENVKVASAAAPVLCEVNSEQIDVPTYHQQVFNRRPGWEAASIFVATKHKSLFETIGLAEQKVEGFLQQADELVDASQFRIANNGENQLGAPTLEELDEWAGERIEASNQLGAPTITGFDEWAGERIEANKSQLANNSLSQQCPADCPFEAISTLAVIETVEVPMFEVSANDASNSIEHKLTPPVLAMPIPMFEVVVVDEAAEGSESPVATSLELDAKAHVGLSKPLAASSIPMFLVDDVEATLPEDLFVNETQSAISFSADSIELQGPARDSYWQYYDDCDRWGVVIVEAQSFEANAVSSVFEKQADSNDEIENGNHSVSLGAAAVLYQIIESNSKLLWVYSLTPQRNLVVDPIEQLRRKLVDRSKGKRQEAISVPAQPLNPSVAAVLIGKPVSEQLGIDSLELTGLLNAKALSRQICELQLRYADRIDELVSRSQEMRESQENKSLGGIAAQCRRLARMLDRFADFISIDVEDVERVAKKGESTSKK